MLTTILDYSYTVVTIVLLAYFLKQHLKENLSLKDTIKRWGLFGFIFNLYSLSWLFTVYPLVWIKEGPAQLLEIAIVYLVVSTVAGLAFFVVGLAKNIKVPVVLRPFVFAVSLTVAEILRSLLLSLIYYGNDSRIDLNWSASTTGNALSSTPFIEYAYFGGVHALTFILGYYVYIFISKKNTLLYKTHALGIFAILLIIHFFVPVNGPPSTTKIAIVTTDFENKTNLTPHAKSKIVHNMTTQLASTSLDIIVYPEDTRYIEYLSPLIKNELLTSFKETLFIDGGTRKIKGGLSNYTIFSKPDLGEIFTRGKSFLMPFNEYIPIAFIPLLQLFINELGSPDYSIEHTYFPEYSSKVFTYKNIRIGTLICSEAISFATIASLKHEHPDIVIYQSRYNSFHNNPWFIMHMRSYVKIAAAQLRTPFIGVSNGSPSLYISPYGSIIDSIPTGFYTKVYILENNK